MADAIRGLPEFELLVEPEINILNYRFVPVHLRERTALDQLTESDDLLIDSLNKRLQKDQASGWPQLCVTYNAQRNATWRRQTCYRLARRACESVNDRI